MLASLRALLDEYRIRRRVRLARTYTTRNLPESTFGRLIGRVRPLDGALLTAPLSGRSCVYYAVTVDVPHRSPGELASEQDAIPFLLDDAEGVAVIDPAHATYSVRVDFTSASKAAFDATPAQRAVLERLDLIDIDWFNVPSLRYREAVIRPDETLSVVGAGVREPGPARPISAGYREGAALRMRITGTARFPLLIRDHADRSV